ncbi:MAG: glycerophosphodiester phosphodiesterase family protein, partial [Candidatus Bathyarchaeota archaeon]|nr:glycerophosphodiester phosphodiesterase family protein [Candidatus Bathyarchaeota archaeon]
MGKTLIIAHRGACAYEPENSLRAIKAAIKLKADMVEVDIRKSKDGKVVVIHDETVNRVSDGEGFVEKLSLRRLKKLNLALGEKIPTLKEVLNLVKDRVKLIIEVKSEGLERKLIKLLEKERMIEDVIVASFNHQIIKRVKTLNRKITCGIVFKCKPSNPSQNALDVEAEIVFPHYSYVSKDFIDSLHKDGLKVYAWTVNNVDDGKILIKNGVDGIVTDKPDIFTGVKFNLKRVFVAGPIQGMEKKQAYRVKLKKIFKNLGFEVLDAWEREKVFYRFNSKHNSFLGGFIKRDLLDIG